MHSDFKWAIVQLKNAVLLLALSTTLCDGASAIQKESRPFRLGMFRINEAFDATKPVAVADSAGYLIQGDAIIGGFDSKFLTSWDFKKRKRLWWSPIEGEPTSPILGVENALFFSTRGGKIYAINSQTGQPLWDLSLDSHAERPILFADGKIYIITVGQVAYSIDALSGKRLWVYDAGFPDNLTVKRPPAPLIADGRLVFGISSGELVAVKIDDGKIAWRYNPLYVNHRFHDPVGEMMYAAGKLILTRYDGLIAQVDMGDNRKVVWQNTTASISTSTFRAGKVYTGLVGGDIMAYDTTTGRFIWRAQSGATPSFIVAGETNVFAIGNDGRVISIDASNGAISWAEDLGSNISAPPIVTEDRMYVSTGLRNVYGYKL